MISQKIAVNVKNGSMIRAMFEEGEKLRKIYGDDKVYDFSLGNPDLEPPEAVRSSLKNLICGDEPDLHKYMNNAGYADVRFKIAGHISEETGLSLTHEHIIMTCGAAGGLNVVLKTLLDPGQEVVIFSPFFGEYRFYIDNCNGKTVICKTAPDVFLPVMEELEACITPNTKAIILNSPNNPTGVIYNEDVLRQINSVLEAKQKEFGTTIYVVSDEPYTKLVYDGSSIPSILSIFKNSIAVNSYSKSLALPGARIGYIAVNPCIDDIELLIGGIVFCNRTLGFVNAPGIFQRVVAEALESSIDIEEYQKRRDMLYNHLTSLGFSCKKPQGAFYLFPKSPIPDDVEFKNHAAKHNILLVPGSGFGYPGYFRIAYCTSLKTIENSLPAFEALAKEFM
ncbi:aspartate aminotransferase [Anaerobacterium chartisolvens]|uniref:Aminotransferase n=1 Tax=Anaerobacterium chartisolvens TaxID=1297424 RepID=A0A369AJQ8_9FIRM|nr:pyridoxal phosphate-dependent aminotransferase [Anaerobacterium chartisolvens]RCX09305.1 aspartate aminotransferase [Anaerobacterium chartisolvens]